MIATNAYPWMTYCNRAGRPFDEAARREAMRDTAAAGIEAWEDFATDVAAVRSAARLAREACLATPSFYANVPLHRDDADEQVATFAEVAEVAANEAGADALVVNAEPIDWAKPLDKDDAQLARQADALAELHEHCGAAGVEVLYHFHTPELRRAAREALRMLAAVPAMRLCLDPDWIFRGSGNSVAAVEAWLGLFGGRVGMVHLRQNVGGQWAQVFALEGDVDFAGVAKALRAAGFAGRVVLEQAVEPETPLEFDVAEAHRRSLLAARDFARAATA